MTSALTLSSFLYFLLFCATMTFSPGPMTLLLLSLGLKDGLRSSIPAQVGASKICAAQARAGQPRLR